MFSTAVVAAKWLAAKGVARVYTPKDFELNRIMLDIVAIGDDLDARVDEVLDVIELAERADDQTKEYTEKVDSFVKNKSDEIMSE